MNPETQARGELVRPPAEPTGFVPAAPTARIVPVPRAGEASLPPQTSTLSMMSLLRALRRRAALALGIALLLAAIAGPAAWFLVPVSFRAEARLHVAAQPPKVLFQTVETQGIGDDYKRYQSTQQTLVRSKLVLAAALRDPEVARLAMIRQLAAPIEWLQDKLKVEFVAGSEVMEISLSGSNPEAVAAVVNAVKKAYMEEVVNVDRKRRMERFDHLNKWKDNYAALLKKKRDTMRKLAESAGSDDRETLALRQQYALEHLHSLQKDLLDFQSRRRKLEAQIRLARGEDETGQARPEPELPSREEIDRLVENHPAIQSLVEQLAQRQEQLDLAKAKASRLTRRPADEPSVAHFNDAVKGLKRLLTRRRLEVRPEVIRQAQKHVTVAEDMEARDLDSELAMVVDLQRQVEEEINSFKLVNQSLTVNTLDLQSNHEEVAQMEVAATKLAQEVEALTVELEAPPRIRNIDDAGVPQSHDDRKRYMMIGMITLGSFLGGLLGIAFLELQTCKVDTADEVPMELGLTVVGALPILPARSHQRGAIARREDEKDRHLRNLLLESVDATRTLLLHAVRTESYQVVMITSAVGGEGKTSLASYLATSLARGGLRTLLIDADLRSPMMHGLFDLPPVPGLSELLRGEVDVDDALAGTAVERLQLLPAGRADRQALSALSQVGVAPLFDRLKQLFDFIVVDTSPILPVADALLIAQHADAALFSVFRDVSRKTKVKAAVERLQRLGVPVLGAVVTGSEGSLYGNYHYGSTYVGLPESVASTPNPS